VRWGVGWDASGESDHVFWWRSVNGQYYSPFNLRAFPFDKQSLTIQLEVPQASCADRQTVTCWLRQTDTWPRPQERLSSAVTRATEWRRNALCPRSAGGASSSAAQWR
jgi:hypothetical protein